MNLAIQVSDLKKSYGSHIVLKDSVPCDVEADGSL